MGRAGQKRDMEIIRDGDVESERVRETEMKRKTKAKARDAEREKRVERGRRRKGNFLGSGRRCSLHHCCPRGPLGPGPACPWLIRAELRCPWTHQALHKPVHLSS